MLTNSINEMVLRIERVNQEYTKAQLDYLQEKIVFLQAQINPHFLYNNLECIRGMVGLSRLFQSNQM
ncbi:MAG TPA: histidine kinase [Clostridiaceae bacterium]|nr:histidine kinase [Clostridiaceae bacterium]